MTKYTAYVIGYIISLVFSFFLIKEIIKSLWRGIGWTGDWLFDPFRTFAWHPVAIGLIETILYITAWIMNQLYIIPIWLTLKVAGSWGVWSQSVKINNRKVAGRTVYNIFLLGNALSLMNGTLGGKSAIWLAQSQYYKTLVSLLAFTLIVLLFWRFSIQYEKRYQKIKKRKPSLPIVRNKTEHRRVKRDKVRNYSK